MLLGCIADDFTGASDVANMLSKGGMSTVQFVGVPRTAAPTGCEAGVVAMKTRSIPAAEAVAQSLAALEWLRSQGCRQFLFKYCSTFDSTPEGNIGPVAEALLASLGAEVAVVCPVFPATGRTLFNGHLFVNHRPLNESGMEKHPLNPMTDANLARWLRLQTRGDVGTVFHEDVRTGVSRIATRLGEEARAGRRLVVVDAIEDGDLLVIGKAVADQVLVTGGSGIALGLTANFREAGLLAGTGSGYAPVKGPGVALSGSCSAASQAQLAHYLESHPGFELEPTELMAGRQTVDQAVDFVLAHLDRQPIVHSTAAPAGVSAAQSRFGQLALSERIEGFFAALAARLVERGVTRIAVGGGETSGAVVSALGASSLLVGPEIDPGVPALAATGGKPLRLALKSGNFGATDFYDKALRVLGEA